MADKVRKLKDNAARHLAKGRVEKALEALVEVVKLEPLDLPSRQKCGDLYRKLGQIPRAISCYQAVAGAYAADGLLLKAIAVSKVILQIDSSHTETQRTLAELYARKRGTSTTHEMPAAMSAAIAAPAVVAPVPGAISEVADSGAVEAIELPPDDGGAMQLLRGGGGADPMVAIGMDSTPTTEPALPSDVVDLEPQGIEIVEEDIPIIEGEETGEEIEMNLVEGIEIEEVVPQTVDLTSLPPIPLFSDLSKNAFVDLLTRMELRHLSPGEVVVREGDQGDSFFIIASGAVQVLKDCDPGGQVTLARLGEGSFFGEMAVLGDGLRAASVVADGECDLFEVSRSMLDEVIAQYPSVEKVLTRFCKQRLLANLLNTSPLFEPLSRDVRKQIIEKFKSRNIAARSTIVEQGQKGDGLYVLLSGQCEVQRVVDRRTTVIATLHAGDVFGEMSLMNREPASASVVSMRDSMVLRLPARSFRDVVMAHPHILEQVHKISELRTQTNREILGPPATSDTLVQV